MIKKFITALLNLHLCVSVFSLFLPFKCSTCVHLASSLLCGEVRDSLITKASEAIIIVVEVVESIKEARGSILLTLYSLKFMSAIFIKFLFFTK